jgi:F420-dependent oxidoreductase-like protein
MWWRPQPLTGRTDERIDVRLGIGMAYWGLGFTKDDQLQVAIQAEALGYDSLWIAEAYGSDAVSVVAWLAAATRRIGLGTAVMQIPGRPPAMTAMSAATLDTLSEGRFRLGLGVSGPQVSEGWYGVDYAKPLRRTREYIDVVRMALARERVHYNGSTIQLPLLASAGKSLKLTIGPTQARMPILLAALGPRNVQLAGAVADGWIPVLFAPEHIDILRSPLDKGACSVGRDPDSIAICPQVAVCVDDDIDAARNVMRWSLALYIGGMGPRDNNFYAQLVGRYGYGKQAKQIQDLYLDGRRDEAAAAVPVELIDLVCVCGPPERVRARLKAYDSTGVDTLILVPAALDAATLTEQVRRIAQAVPEYLDNAERTDHRATHTV